MAPSKQRKVAIVGSRSVGKSSLAVQFVDGHFVESYYPTIENTFSKVIRFKGQDFTTEIVDTAGQDEYSILNSKHFIGIHGYMLVYSVSSLPSFEMVQVIREKILNHLGTDWVPIVIVGNKSDLRPEQRQVSQEDGRKLAEKFNCAWTEASARYNENVAKAFELLIAQIEKSQNPSETTSGGKIACAQDKGQAPQPVPAFAYYIILVEMFTVNRPNYLSTRISHGLVPKNRATQTYTGRQVLDVFGDRSTEALRACYLTITVAYSLFLIAYCYTIMSSQENVMTCPLCGYKTDREYSMLLHMEELHAEGLSPFVADLDLDASRGREPQTAEQEVSSSDDADDAQLFVECPIEGCLEQISLAELEDHVDFHAIEQNEETTPDGVAPAADVAPSNANAREYQSPYARLEDVARSSHRHRREPPQPSTNNDSTIDAWKKIFGRRHARKIESLESRSADGKPSKKRLGKSELGKHAYEHHMPDSLVTLLKRGKYTSAEAHLSVTAGIIPALANLLEESPSTEHAYLCHPAVQHISKLRGEGGFCGYRNIQMLSSYIVGAHAEGTEKLDNRIPSIFRIQDYIENAWDMGINASGRIETGGIKGTRKYIGTPEAQAMFIGLKIPCEAEGFKSPKQGVAEAALFASVQQYFEGASFDPREKVRQTNLPPIYFQHRGHSLTIVGLERRVSGSLKLLVFDPMFHDPAGIIRIARRTDHHGGDSKEDRNKARTPMHRSAESALRLYRRGNNYLKKYHEFELLRLKVTPT
ncbi:hypothetical protein O1611_g3195 [Lasiodiplodia mahajangana]|uniref:Uncharacterized protein n=1 Tax=Lasiodiplodia mahajangana TaxID=1108764 RepID=A0ACC2JSV6_9PEZI|nr:hypothetical protein O1611_g3195 [Lasiodiplodia mahajangana]